MWRRYTVTLDQLAKVYARDSHCALAIAQLCDDHIDKSGELLGYVRDRATEIKKDPSVVTR